jgi:hypothetical protein
MDRKKHGKVTERNCLVCDDNFVLCSIRVISSTHMTLCCYSTLWGHTRDYTFKDSSLSTTMFKRSCCYCV